jgi:hypothetical protein
MPDPRVAILGCGPAGLMAAHACAVSGIPFVILSKGGSEGAAKSRLGGAQFLHEPIPGLTGKLPDAVVNYYVTGDAQTYQQKAYREGAQPTFVSFDYVYHGATQVAWNLVAAYDQLWRLYGDHVTEVTLNAGSVDELLSDFELIVSSVPLPALCRAPSDAAAGEMPNGHTFTKQHIKIRPGCALPEGYPTGPDQPAMTIFYNGDRNQAWYRSSALWGHHYTEYGAGLYVFEEDLIPATKPLSTNCDCHTAREGGPPDWRFLPVGRFGLWRKGVLTHEAFNSTQALLVVKGWAKPVR